MMIAQVLLGLIILATIRSGADSSHQQQPDFEIASGCGVVEGRVLDSQGHPVAQAKVYSFVLDHPGRGRVRYAVSSPLGNFILGCAEPGRNAIYVSKEDEDYPDTLLTPFIDPKIVPIINVSEQRTIRGVEVRLSPRAGRLIARVNGGNTKRPIEGATVTICRAAYPRDCHSLNQTASGFSQLVPPVAFTIKASAPDYYDWYYGSDGLKKHATIIQLAPGTTKGVVIELRRKIE
jgi:hypothetical protein